MRKIITLIALMASTPALACTYTKDAFEREKKIYYGITALDAATTIYGVDHGAREVNPLFGSHPSNERVIGQTIALDILYTLVINHTYKRDVCAAKTAQRINLFIHGAIVGANLRIIF